VVIPPLRERPEDVPLLVEHFASLYDRGSPRKVFSDEALEVLRGYPWPLNVRELQQVVERVVCLLDHDVVGAEDLPAHLRWPAGGTVREGAFPPLREVVEKAEREHLLRALAAAKGSKRRAIELLQISSETFYRRLDEFGLRKKGE